MGSTWMDPMMKDSWVDVTDARWCMKSSRFGTTAEKFWSDENARWELFVAGSGDHVGTSAVMILRFGRDDRWTSTSAGQMGVVLYRHCY
jgi:hypothetical protein